MKVYSKGQDFDRHRVKERNLTHIVCVIKQKYSRC